MKKRKRRPDQYLTMAVLQLPDGEAIRAEVNFGPVYAHCRVIHSVNGEWLYSTWGRMEDVRKYGVKRVWEWAMGILKKLQSRAADRTAQMGKPDAATKKRYPAVVELLTEPVDADGNSRELSSVTVKWQDGTWKVAVHEPNLEMSLWASASTLDAAIEALEQRLNAEDADWRGWSVGQKRGPAKGKK